MKIDFMVMKLGNRGERCIASLLDAQMRLWAPMSEAAVLVHCALGVEEICATGICTWHPLLVHRSRVTLVIVKFLSPSVNSNTAFRTGDYTHRNVRLASGEIARRLHHAMLISLVLCEAISGVERFHRPPIPRAIRSESTARRFQKPGRSRGNAEYL